MSDDFQDIVDEIYQETIEELFKTLETGLKFIEYQDGKCISFQDNKWWLFEKGGDGIIGAKTLRELISKMRLEI